VAAVPAEPVVGPHAELVPVKPAVPVASPAAPVQKPGPPPPSKAKPSFLHLHRWQALAALIVLIGAGALSVRWWLGPKVTTESVIRRDFVQTVVASGHVEAPHRLDVGVQITGTVLRIPVIEG
jgi:HlyD family secretion protein